MRCGSTVHQWYVLSVTEVLQHFEVDQQAGLSDAEAEQRRASYGSNELQDQRHRSAVRMLFDQFTDFMILVLLVAAIISGLIGEAADAIA